MQEEIKIELKRLRKEAVKPFYARPGDAGMDLCAACDLSIAPGECKAVPTGWALNIPPGYEVQIRPRSGLSLRTRLRIPNAPGTIDSGYKDELAVLLYNASAEHGDSAGRLLDIEEKDNRSGTYRIRRGDRIAQMVPARCAAAELVLTEAFTEGVADRGGGFGSSGVREEEA